MSASSCSPRPPPSFLFTKFCQIITPLSATSLSFSAKNLCSSDWYVTSDNRLIYSFYSGSILIVAYLQDMKMHHLVAVGHAIAKPWHPWRWKLPPEHAAQLLSSRTVSRCGCLVPVHLYLDYIPQDMNVYIHDFNQIEIEFHFLVLLLDSHGFVFVGETSFPCSVLLLYTYILINIYCYPLLNFRQRLLFVLFSLTLSYLVKIEPHALFIRLIAILIFQSLILIQWFISRHVMHDL